MSRFFTRQFLGEENDESNSTFVTASVASSQSDWLSASIIIGGAPDHSDERVFLGFSAYSTEEEVDRAIMRADKLVQIVSDFAKALKAEGAEVKKEMKKREK